MILSAAQALAKAPSIGHMTAEHTTGRMAAHTDLTHSLSVSIKTVSD